MDIEVFEITTLRENDREHLLVIGRVAQDGHVRLLVDGMLLGVTTARNGVFKFRIKRLARSLQEGLRISVENDSGPIRHKDGSSHWIATEPYTSDEFVDLVAAVKAGRMLTKKGTLSKPIDDATKDAYLEAYNIALSWFRERTGYSLFVSHGTLLGLYRDGDIIPHDDDFDCFYLSRIKDVENVAIERTAIIRRMRQSGLRVRIGPTGHIKLITHGVRLDVMPAWIEGQTLNIAGFTAIDDGAHLVSDPMELPFRGGLVQTFGNPVPFLEHQYGPTWQRFDPGYRSRPSKRALDNRAKLRPSFDEVQAFGVD